jgi:hypothetical protein
VTDAKLETFEHAGEIVRVPAVAEYQGDSDRLGVLTGPKVTGRSPEQLLEVVVHVQLLEDCLDERTRPSERLSRGDRRADKLGSSVVAPALGDVPPGNGASQVLRRALIMR